MKQLLRILFAAGLIFGSVLTVSGRTLKVMSYNVHNGVGLDGLRDHGRIGAIIAAENPDFVAVQEVDSMTSRSGGTYVLGEIAESAGMNAIFAPAISFDGGLYGIGLLVREQPDSVSRIPLPGREEERMLVIADYPDYAVACTHFSLTPEDALLSTEIVRQEAWKRPGRLMILMGDLNSHPDSPVIETLCRTFAIVNATDVPTFPADHPKETIDFIMVSGRGKGLDEANVKVVDEPVASDHRPVVALLRSDSEM